MPQFIGRPQASVPIRVWRWPSQPVLALLLGVALPAAAHADPAAPDPFAKGARYWSVTAGASHRATIAWSYMTQANVSYYLFDDVAVTYGGTFGYLDANRNRNGVFGGPELGLRWHVAKGARWSTYLEASTAPVFQQHPLNERSLRFNFDLQSGGGATYRLSQTLMLRGGCRLHHLSNARVRGKEHNFGYDGPLLYLGLMRAF